MKKVCLALLLLCFSCSLAFANIKGNIDFTKTYENAKGNVTFYHKKHAERFIDDCGYCHSALKTFGGEVTKLYGHEVCRKCHESHHGPTNCDNCHSSQNTSIK